MEQFMISPLVSTSSVMFRFFLVHVYDYLSRPVTDLTSPLQLYFHGHTFEADITLCASLIDMLEPLVAVDSPDVISMVSKR